MPKFEPAVLDDWLKVVFLEPSAVHVWHHLFSIAMLATKPEKSAIVARVRRLAPEAGFGRSLAFTFCHALSADSSDLNSASKAFVQSALPAEAGLALLHTAYAAALGSGSNLHGFVATLRDSGFLEVLLNLGQRLCTPTAARRHRSGRRQLERIAVVAPTLSSAFHAPTDLALRHAGLLLDNGFETSVFAAQEFQLPAMGNWLGVPRTMKIDPAQPQGWPRSKGAMKVQLARTEMSMAARWNALMGQIDQFNPDAVLFIGPYSPLITPLYQSYPIVGLGTNTVAPAGPLDVWLAPHIGAQATWRPFYDVRNTVSYSQRFSLSKATVPRERQLIGLPDAAVVWVTSGSRLTREISREWRDAVLAELNQQPSCHWLLVGLSKDQSESLGINHPRVHLRGFDTQLPELFSACDLYLNPPRMGGGHSVVCAMAQGLAILALAGSDGGDKLGPWAQSDMPGYFKALNRLAQQTSARQEMGELLRQRYLDVLDLVGGLHTLVGALRDSIEMAGSERTVAPST